MDLICISKTSPQYHILRANLGKAAWHRIFGAWRAVRRARECQQAVEKGISQPVDIDILLVTMIELAQAYRHWLKVQPLLQDHSVRVPVEVMAVFCEGCVRDEI